MSKEKVEIISTFFKMNYSSSSFFFLLATSPALAAASMLAMLNDPVIPVFTFLPAFELEFFWFFCPNKVFVSTSLLLLPGVGTIFLLFSPW